MKNCILLLPALVSLSSGFSLLSRNTPKLHSAFKPPNNICFSKKPLVQVKATPSDLDLETVSLVVGQETYGLAFVCVLEAVSCFVRAPSFSKAVQILGPAGLAGAMLTLVSGNLVTSGEASKISLGLEISVAVTIFLGVSYILRLNAPLDASSPKESAFFGLIVAIAGFFSFSQNLTVNGFVVLPSLPSIPLPSISLPTFPSIDFPF